MLECIDLNYLCANLGNLSAMPVRLFDGEEQIFYYSIIALPVDPFLPYRKDVFAIDKHVGYFVAPHDYFYGVASRHRQKSYCFIFRINDSVKRRA